MKIELTEITCPKHGTHIHSILSTIPEHSGAWCQICWLESLGEPLPYTKVPMEITAANMSSVPEKNLT